MSIANRSTARLVIGMSPLLAESQPLNMFSAWWRFQSQRKPTRGTEQVGVAQRPASAFREDTDLGKGSGASRPPGLYVCPAVLSRLSVCGKNGGAGRRDRFWMAALCAFRPKTEVDVWRSLQTARWKSESGKLRSATNAKVTGW
jgi:hypothetical protein